jgi:hypothetical protein
MLDIGVVCPATLGHEAMTERAMGKLDGKVAMVRRQARNGLGRG